MTSELEAAERAVAMQPNDAALWYRLGLACLDSGQLEKSEPCWRNRTGSRVRESAALSAVETQTPPYTPSW